MYNIYFILKNLLSIDFKRFPFKSFINLFSIICTAICITFIILTLSINNSFKEIVIKKIISVDGFLTLYDYHNNSLNDDDYIEVSEKINENFICSKLVERNILIKNKNNSEGVQLKCINLSNNNVFNLKNNLIKGDINHQGVIIGSNLAEKLNVKLNQAVTLIDLKNENINIADKKVVGIFKTHLPEYDHFVIYGDINEMKYFLNYENSYDSIVINDLNQEFDKEIIINAIDHKYYKLFWDNKHNNFINWLLSYDKPVNILLFFVFLICLLNLFASNYIDYSYRRNEIKLYSILGLNLNLLKFIFLLKTLIIGVFGFLSGVLISYLFYLMQNKFSIIKIPSNVYFMETLPISFDITQIIAMFFILFISLSAGSLIAFFPLKKQVN